jgi:hypothetical protein
VGSNVPRQRLAAGKTLRLTAPNVNDLDPAAVYVISAPGTEARGRAPVWETCLSLRSTNCTEIIDSTPTTMIIRFWGSSPLEIPLNDPAALAGVFRGFRMAYVDISGMPHHVWAPLVRAGFAVLDTLYAIYTEPDVYKKHPNPTSRTEFDLSEGFRGIEPLPGLAKLRGPSDENNSILVALLGFEGRRASHLALALDPVPKVFAIIGVPGFRVEYPQITYASNEDFLSEFRAHANARYAAASCPFEAFDALTDIQRDSGGKYMYIAPIGTKPHALGAICYALKHQDNTEIMYDHPNRKAGRTAGIGTMHVYTLKPSHVAS